MDAGEACRFVLTKFGANEVRDFQIGRTTVFLTDSMFNRLEAEISSKRWRAISKWQRAVFRFLDEKREEKRVALEKQRKQIVEVKNTNLHTNSNSNSNEIFSDSAIHSPMPRLEPILIDDGRDYLQEAIDYLLHWQLIDDDRHMLPAAKHVDSLLSLLPSDASVLKTVVGAFMRQQFPKVQNASEIASPSKKDNSYLSKIFAAFSSDKNLGGLQHFVLATLLTVSCQNDGIENLLATFQKQNANGVHSELGLSFGSNSNSSGVHGASGLDPNFVVSQVLNSISSMSNFNHENKGLLWILALHILSAYDATANQVKQVLSIVAADVQQSTSVTAPHLVMFAYQKLYPVMRQLVRNSWNSPSKFLFPFKSYT